MDEAAIFTIHGFCQRVLQENAFDSGAPFEEARFTLDTNWRSSSRMIDAFNHLFTQAAAPFIFEPDITYEKVLPSPRADKAPLLIDGVEPAPMQLRYLPLTAANASASRIPCILVGAARESAALACAEEIAELLTRSDQGRAVIGEERVCAKDIAVLVRSRFEGELVQEALRGC